MTAAVATAAAAAASLNLAFPIQLSFIGLATVCAVVLALVQFRQSQQSSNASASLNLTPRQLPNQSPVFIDRRAEVRDLFRTLKYRSNPRGTCRVVAICGSGGTGKTSLALRVAHKASKCFPDGQVFINMLPTPESPLPVSTALQRILQSLGVDRTAMPQHDDELASLFLSRTSPLALLIVLDNVADAHQIRRVLPAGDDCGVIVTSRSRLTDLEVDSYIELGPLQAEDAKELVVKLVRSPGSSEDTNLFGEMASLCGRLPLAIQIAAAKLRAQPQWTPMTLIQKLRSEQGRLSVLETEADGVSASLSISYELLSPPAKELFYSYGLFSSSTLPVWLNHALLSGPEQEREAALSELIQSNLANPVKAAGSPAWIIQLHDLTRLYAADKLNDNRSEARVDRQAKQVLSLMFALADQGVSQVQPGDQKCGLLSALARVEIPSPTVHFQQEDPIAWFEADRGILRDIKSLACRPGAAKTYAGITVKLVTFWDILAYFDEAEDHHLFAIQLTVEAGLKGWEAKLRSSYGNILRATERYGEALDQYNASLEIWTELDDGVEAALTSIDLGVLKRVQRDVETATSLFTKSLRIVAIHLGQLW